MKKIIFSLIATIGLSGLSFGQAVLEHTYESYFGGTSSEHQVFLTENGLHFFTFNNTTNVIQVYDSLHTLIKTINIPSEINVAGIKLMSDKLFNNDNLLEFMVQSGYGDTVYLINETGTILQDFGIGLYGIEYDVVLIKTGNDYKLIIRDMMGTLYNVYSLPGTYLEIVVPSISSKLFGYPNPIADRIMITNPLENGENALLEVFDMNGKRILKKNISGNEAEIILDVSNLNNGTYIYKINGETNKFIKK